MRLTLDELIAKLVSLRADDETGSLPVRYDDGIEDTQIESARFGTNRLGDPEIILS